MTMPSPRRALVTGDIAAGLGNLTAAYRRCVGELGMWSAARLFVETARAFEGEAGVSRVRETLGPEFPLLDLVAAGAPTNGLDAIEDVVALGRQMRRIVVVGLEADCLELLASRLPEEIDLALLLDPTFPVDMERVRAAWSDRVTLTDLGSFQRFAGTRSALLTTIYGTDGFSAVVARVWLRLHGDDVRTQFRSLIGWNVLSDTLDRYPRWNVTTDAADFTDIFTPAERR